MRNKGPNLDRLLKEPLQENFIDSAMLLAMVNGGDPRTVSRLILFGATSTDYALAKSRKEKQYAVTAALLINKAAMENDRILVLKLYGENVQGDTKIPLTEEDNLEELQAAVAGGNIRTVVPIEISRRNNASAVREELLLRTDVDKDSGVVLWFGLRLTQLEISWLKKIYWVKKLRLARNEFSSLPPEMGSYLKQCTKLDLQWNRIQEIPACLLELPSINELNLSHNDIIDIPDVPEWSASLSVLDLSYNHLSNLPNSTVAPTLKNLNISNNQFRKVPHCVCSFVGLLTLNIANNSNIRSLQPELGRLRNLLNLNLDGLNLKYPPRSVRGMTADCIRYLNSCLCSPRGYYHMKMMIVGKQAMGKSTIVARLHNKDIGNESTVGVDISEWKYAPAYNRKTFHFNIWDFAGQEEYYATHQCFLSKRSLYLLVWNVTEGDAGVADLKPWLNNISVRAPDSCIIVVGTFLDKVSEEDRQSGKIDDLLRKVEELTRQYRRLVVANITVVGLKGRMENVAKLKDYIYNAAAEHKIKKQYVMGHKIPSSYHALDNKLSTIHRQVKDGNHEPIMHAAEFQKMVRDLNLVDIQDDDELRKATYFLHEVGALLHYDDRKHNLDDLYFVDPRWLCNHLMLTVVTVKQRNPYVKQGILRSKNIPLLFKDKRFPNRYFNQYLTLLNRFEIALPLDKDYKRILIPSMLPERRPDVVAMQQLDDKSCYKRFILFRPSVAQGQAYRRPTSPGFWSRLLSRIMNTVKEVRNIISDHVPVEEEDLVISSNLSCMTSSRCTTNLFNSDSEDQLCPVTETGLMFETCSVKLGDSNASEGPLENDGVQLPTSSSPTDLTSETLSVNCSNFSDPDIDKSTVPSPMSSSPTASESLLSTTKSTFSSKDPINDNTEIELMSEKPSVYCNVFSEPKVDTSTMLSSESVTPTSSESLLRTTTTALHEYTMDPITENGLISKTIECDLLTIPSPGPSLPTV